MKRDMTLHALYVMKQILVGIKRSDYVRVESWTESEGRTLKTMLEVRVASVTYP